MLILVAKLDPAGSNYPGSVPWWCLATLRPLFNKAARRVFNVFRGRSNMTMRPTRVKRLTLSLLEKLEDSEVQVLLFCLVFESLACGAFPHESPGGRRTCCCCCKYFISSRFQDFIKIKMLRYFSLSHIQPSKYILELRNSLWTFSSLLSSGSEYATRIS